MAENFEIISVFTTTSPTIHLESLPRSGDETDLTAGSLVITDRQTGDKMVLTVIGTS
jgi:hypothetical protein